MSINSIRILKSSHKSKGFTLFELMVAIIVLSIGLIGIATLMSQGIRSNYSASARSDATFIAVDIADRMRSAMVNTSTLTQNLNTLAGSFAINTKADDNYDVHGGTIDAQCNGDDACEWEASIENLLPEGQGTVARDGTGTAFMITLRWDDDRTGATGLNCSGNTDNDLTCFHTIFQP